MAVTHFNTESEKEKIKWIFSLQCNIYPFKAAVSERETMPRLNVVD